MVEIQNLTASYVDVSFARRIVQGTLQSLRMCAMIEVGVVFVGVARMRRLNKMYHHENRVTDVLSFSSSPSFPVLEPYGHRYLGEMVVCAQYVKKEALGTHTPYRRALAHILIHGTLHLMGYRHEDGGKDAILMHAKEEEIMSRICGK